MVHLLLKLAALTGDERPREEAGRVLARHAELLGKLGVEMAWWLDAVLLWNGPGGQVVIAGDGPDARALAGVADRLMAPWVLSVRLPAGGAGPGLARLAPALAGKTAGEGAAVAWLCRQGSCELPTSDGEALKKQILQGWTR